jgi:hypothetical protein
MRGGPARIWPRPPRQLSRHSRRGGRDVGIIEPFVFHRYPPAACRRVERQQAAVQRGSALHQCQSPTAHNAPLLMQPAVTLSPSISVQPVASLWPASCLCCGPICTDIGISCMASKSLNRRAVIPRASSRLLKLAIDHRCNSRCRGSLQQIQVCAVDLLDTSSPSEQRSRRGGRIEIRPRSTQI